MTSGSASFDLLNYICPPNGKSFMLSSNEACQSKQAADGWIVFAKNVNAEEFYADDHAIYRGADTSLLSQDGVHANGTFYVQRDPVTDAYGCAWAARYMRVGDVYHRVCTVVTYDHTGKEIGRDPSVASDLILKAHFDALALPSGVTVADVLEFQWGGEELYLYARNCGLVGWKNLKGGSFGNYLTRFDVPVQTPFPHAIARPQVPFPPTGETPVTLPLPDPATLGDLQPGVVRPLANFANVRALPSASASVLRALTAGNAIRYRPQTFEGGGYTASGQVMNTWYMLDTGYVAAGVITITAGTPDTPTFKLDVPFVAQQGATANRFNEDCGVADSIMVARYAYVAKGMLDPVNFTVDDWAAKTALATKDVGLQPEQVARLLNGYGVRAEARRPLALADLAALIQNKLPPIVLVNYKHVNPNHPTNLGHFIVLVAVGERGFWCHDPYLLGANVYVSNEALTAAMSDVSAFATFPQQAIVLAA